MNTLKNIKSNYLTFVKVAKPYIFIRDEASYTQALTILEALLDEAEDHVDEPLNGLTDLLSNAIELYENGLDELVQFDRDVHQGPPDVAMLRLLMEQHQLSLSDFPELGDKSLISKILSGQRNMTKKHIEKLSKRFDVRPGLFFE